MKRIRLHYDAETGKLKGYYPLNVEYTSVPKPYIEISNDQYRTILHNEIKYRVQNKELVNISDTVEYRLNEMKRFVNEAATKIATKAAEAESWGVILVNEEYYINVHWKEYYKNLLTLLDKAQQNLCVKIYAVHNNKYYLDYKEFSPENAKVFLEQALEAIESYCTQYLPEKQNAYVSELKTIKKSKNSAGIVNFINSIDYGQTINESTVTIPLNIQ